MTLRIIAFWTVLVLSAIGPRQAPPKAVVDGQAVSDEYLVAGMAEAAGALVLEEAILDSLLAKELELAGKSVGDADLARERTAVIELMSSGADTDPGAASVVLDRLRRSRGLGPVRFQALLKRNASLRLLVGAGVNPTTEETASALSLEFGPRVRARLLTVSDRQVAAQLRERLAGIADTRERILTFSEMAMQHSSDASAGRGGLFESLSPADPGIPVSVQAAIGALKPGELSEVIGLERGSAIALVEHVAPGRTPTASESAQCERRLRVRLERLAMDRLARQLLAQAKVTVFEDSLRWSWDGR